MKDLEVLVTVRCKAGHIKQFGKEGPPGGFAICDRCYRPMMPVRAKAKRVRRQEAQR